METTSAKIFDLLISRSFCPSISDPSIFDPFDRFESL